MSTLCLLARSRGARPCVRRVAASVAFLLAALAVCLAAVPGGARAQDSRNLAPGFTQLPKAARVVVMPVDVELYSLSAGGVPEPRGDWTAAGVTARALERCRTEGARWRAIDALSQTALADARAADA